MQKLSEGLKDRGHEVTIVCGGSSSKSVERLDDDGIQVFQVPTFAPNNSFHIPRNRKMIEELIDNDWDVVHTHSAHSVLSLLPLELKRSWKAKWKLIYSMHFSTPGYTFFRSFLWKLFWQRRLNSGLKFVDAVHSTSSFESKTVLNQFSNAKGKVSLIPLGLDEDVFGRRWTGQQSDYVLYCGRVEKYKGLDLAVESVERVRELGHAIKFLIVGSGSRSSFYKKLSERKDWIIYLSHRERNDYLDLLSNARAVINLSSAENFNIFLAEACAIGVPIVATPGAAAFCPKYASVNCFEANGVAEVIAQAVSDSDAFVFPRNCTPRAWKDAVGEFEKLYTDTLEGKYKQ